MSDGPSEATTYYFAVQSNVGYFTSIVHDRKHRTISRIKKIEAYCRPYDRRVNRRQADVVGFSAGFDNIRFKYRDPVPCVYYWRGLRREIASPDGFFPAFQIASHVTDRDSTG
jgi:hypothetical protein